MRGSRFSIAPLPLVAKANQVLGIRGECEDGREEGWGTTMALHTTKHVVKASLEPPVDFCELSSELMLMPSSLSSCRGELGESKSPGPPLDLFHDSVRDYA